MTTLTKADLSGKRFERADTSKSESKGTLDDLLGTLTDA